MCSVESVQRQSAHVIVRVYSKTKIQRSLVNRSLLGCLLRGPYTNTTEAPFKPPVCAVSYQSECRKWDA